MPPKAAKTQLAEDDTEYFDFWLADRLHMTVAEMHRRVSHAEYVRWAEFHPLRLQREAEAAKKAQGG